MYFSKKYYPELFFLISTEEIRGSGLSAPVNIHSELRIFNALIEAPSDSRIRYLREQALVRPDPVCDRTIDPVVSIRIIPAMKDVLPLLLFGQGVIFILGQPFRELFPLINLELSQFLLQDKPFVLVGLVLIYFRDNGVGKVYVVNRSLILLIPGDRSSPAFHLILKVFVEDLSKPVGHIVRDPAAKRMVFKLVVYIPECRLSPENGVGFGLALIILEIRAEAVPFPIHVGFRVNTVIGTHCAPSSLLNCSLLSKE